MKLSIEQINELAKLHKRFVELYKETGLAGVGYTSVQLSFESFMATFKTFAVRVLESDKYPYRYSAVCNGTLFITVSTVAEAAGLEETMPEQFEYISKILQAESV